MAFEFVQMIEAMPLAPDDYVFTLLTKRGDATARHSDKIGRRV